MARTEKKEAVKKAPQAKRSKELPSGSGETPDKSEALRALAKTYGETTDDFTSSQDQVAEYADRNLLTIPGARRELGEIKQKAVAAEFNERLKIQSAKISKEVKRQLHIPVEGRRPGSRTRRSKKEVRATEASHKALVLQAIKALYGGKYSESERKNVVAEYVGITPRTLSRWIKLYEWKWDQLVAIGARGHGNSK